MGNQRSHRPALSQLLAIHQRVAGAGRLRAELVTDLVPTRRNADLLQLPGPLHLGPAGASTGSRLRISLAKLGRRKSSPRSWDKDLLVRAAPSSFAAAKFISTQLSFGFIRFNYQCLSEVYPLEMFSSQPCACMTEHPCGSCVHPDFGIGVVGVAVCPGWQTPPLAGESNSHMKQDETDQPSQSAGPSGPCFMLRPEFG